jgi:hypothetical protein
MRVKLDASTATKIRDLAKRYIEVCENFGAIIIAWLRHVLSSFVVGTSHLLYIMKSTVKYQIWLLVSLLTWNLRNGSEDNSGVLQSQMTECTIHGTQWRQGCCPCHRMFGE